MPESGRGEFGICADYYFWEYCHHRMDQLFNTELDPMTHDEKTFKAMGARIAESRKAART
jgi:hypothetical protein